MPNYNITNETGKIIARVEGVLDPVRLTGCSTSSGSNVLTVNATTALHPGMMVSCAGIPRGSFIVAIKDATTVILALSKWNTSTSIWETTEALANATATAGTLTAIFHGHLDVPVLSLQPTGTYRDDFDSTRISAAAYAASTLGASSVANGYIAEGGAVTVPGISKLNDRVGHVSPRHRSESFGVWLFVCTDGHVCHVPTGEYLAVVLDVA